MKKIIALCLVVILAATAVIGGTLAYFTDKDAQTNTFTVGNVAIDLYEDFGDNDEQGIEHLSPVVYEKDEEGNTILRNAIEKEVYVENTGSEPAYVRVHIAIPDALDDGKDTFNASLNLLHFNYAKDSVAAGKWDWSKAVDDNKTTGDWNYYEVKLNENGKDVQYNVYVVTYTTALEKGQTTCSAMNRVYLDKDATNEKITTAKSVLGDNWKIYVFAEAGQVAGFDNAYDALNEQFGNPMAADYTAPTFTTAAENKTWVDGEAPVVPPVETP